MKLPSYMDLVLPRGEVDNAGGLTKPGEAEVLAGSSLKPAALGRSRPVHVSVSARSSGKTHERPTRTCGEEEQPARKKPSQQMSSLCVVSRSLEVPWKS